MSRLDPRLTRLLELAEEQGFSVERTSKGHFTFRDPSGRRVATASKTASDTRSLKNTTAHLRRGGLKIPRK